jgi:hypothetical protein
MMLSGILFLHKILCLYFLKVSWYEIERLTGRLGGGGGTGEILFHLCTISDKARLRGASEPLEPVLGGT